MFADRMGKEKRFYLTTYFNIICTNIKYIPIKGPFPIFLVESPKQMCFEEKTFCLLKFKN